MPTACVSRPGGFDVSQAIRRRSNSDASRGAGASAASRAAGAGMSVVVDSSISATSPVVTVWAAARGGAWLAVRRCGSRGPRRLAQLRQLSLHGGSVMAGGRWAAGGLVGQARQHEAHSAVALVAALALRAVA